jgi:hypothetical protein
MAIATGLAVAELWAGLALAYYAPRLPPSFAITAVATAVYSLALVGRAGSLRDRGTRTLLRRRDESRARASESGRLASANWTE